MLKILLCGFAQETNTFSAFNTSLQDFKNSHYSKKLNLQAPNYYEAPLVAMYQLAQQEQWEIIESLCTYTDPQGKILQHDYETIRDNILNDIEKEQPDIVFFHLHGAMMAEAYDDCEGDILKRTRDALSCDALIAALFDPHTHLTEQMVTYCDIPIWMKEYPHTDAIDRTNELFHIIKNCLANKVKPVISVYDCNMINMYPTSIEPMLSYLSAVKTLEKEDATILSTSIIHGFPFADSADLGTKILVITNNQKIKGDAVAQKLGKELQNIALGQPLITLLSLDDTLSNIKQQSRLTKPIVIADFSDNPGGGAYADATFILDAIIENRMKHCAFACFYDKKTVLAATKAGINTSFTVAIGGKGSDFSGKPILLNVQVKNICNDLIVRFADGDFSYGKSVCLHHEALDLDIIVCSQRTQTYNTECFTKMGVDIKSRYILVVKSSEHFRASFKMISDNIYQVQTPGLLNFDYATRKYRELQRRVVPINAE